MNKERKEISEHEKFHLKNEFKPDYIPEHRDKMGKLAQEAQQKDTDSLNAQELGAEMTKNYMAELFKTYQEGEKIYKGDFFLVVLTKRERAMVNVLRNFFLHRSSCPTPNYDQAVYHYQKKEDRMVLLWVIPDREFCFYIKDNILGLSKELKDLSQFVFDFDDGTLMTMAKKLNNEDVLEGGITMQILKEGSHGIIQ